MTSRQFQHDFRRGLGSALLKLETNRQPRRYADIVRQGCLELWGYDYQCEPDRGWYLARCLTLADPDGLGAVVERFEQPVVDDWLFVQLTEILSHLAQDGRHEARTALRAARRRWAGRSPQVTRRTWKDRTFETFGLDRFTTVASALLAVDGWQAVEAVVDEARRGRLAAGIDLELFWSDAREGFGDERVDACAAALPAAPDQARRVSLMTSRQAAAVVRSAPGRNPPTLAETLAEVTGPQRQPDGSVVFRGSSAVRQFVRRASADEIDQLARIALAETDVAKRAEMVFGMTRATYAWPEETLASWTTSRNDKLRAAAFRIMESNPAPRWRDLALSLVDQGRDVGWAVSLLASSGLPSDAEALLGAVRSLVVRQSGWPWHTAFWSVQEAVEAGRWPRPAPLLDHLYRKTLCPGCRHRVVRTMAERGVLADHIVEEARYDSWAETRELVGRPHRPTEL